MRVGLNPFISAKTLSQHVSSLSVSVTLFSLFIFLIFPLALLSSPVYSCIHVCTLFLLSHFSVPFFFLSFFPSFHSFFFDVDFQVPRLHLSFITSTPWSQMEHLVYVEDMLHNHPYHIPMYTLTHTQAHIQTHTQTQTHTHTQTWMGRLWTLQSPRDPISGTTKGTHIHIPYVVCGFFFFVVFFFFPFQGWKTKTKMGWMDGKENAWVTSVLVAVGIVIFSRAFFFFFFGSSMSHLSHNNRPTSKNYTPLFSENGCCLLLFFLLLLLELFNW